MSEDTKKEPLSKGEIKEGVKAIVKEEFEKEGVDLFKDLNSSTPFRRKPTSSFRKGFSVAKQKNQRQRRLAERRNPSLRKKK